MSERQKRTTSPPASSSKRKLEDEGSEYLRRKHNFIKSTIRTDYQPDICKDYKETGFCGFGDSCKFLHDRSDYKHGWQLDQEWAKGQYKDDDDDKYLIKDDDEGGAQEEGIPLECAHCKETYRSPVVTKCKHYFCMDCAEGSCNEKCVVCHKPTSGIFKNASKVINDAKSKANQPPTRADRSSINHKHERNKEESDDEIKPNESEESDDGDSYPYLD